MTIFGAKNGITGQLRRHHARLRLHIGSSSLGSHEGRARLSTGSQTPKRSRLLAGGPSWPVQSRRVRPPSLSTPSCHGLWVWDTREVGPTATQLCFADFSGYELDEGIDRVHAHRPASRRRRANSSSSPIASTPYTLSFCLHVSSNRRPAVDHPHVLQPQRRRRRGVPRQQRLLHGDTRESPPCTRTASNAGHREVDGHPGAGRQGSGGVRVDSW